MGKKLVGYENFVGKLRGFRALASSSSAEGLYQNMMV
jgi:hypothetical protein